MLELWSGLRCVGAPEDIEKVQKYLGVQQEPAWYVSSINAT